jgi:hypothetical protein
LLAHGTIEAFIQLLRAKHMEVVEQAVWGLGNISGDGVENRNIVIDAGAVQPITQLLNSAPPTSSFIRNASWCLSNFCRGRPAP